MLKLKKVIPIGLLLAIGAISNSASLAQAPNAAKLAELIEVQGSKGSQPEVYLKHQISNAPTTKWERVTRPGGFLKRGDLLRVKRGSKAVIRCTANKYLTYTVPDDGVPWGVASICSSSK